MKEDILFGSDKDQCYFSEYGQQIRFLLQNQCRIYRYERQVGVYLSLYFDHYDESALLELAKNQGVENDFCSPLSLSDEPQFLLKAVAFNFETQVWDDVPFSDSQGPLLALGPEEGENTSVEIRLRAPHLDDFGNVHLKLQFTFGLNLTIRSGFLGNKVTEKSCVLPCQEAELQTLLLHDVDKKEEQEPSQKMVTRPETDQDFHW